MVGGHTEPTYERGPRLGDGFIFAADEEGAVAAWSRVQHHLAEQGRSEAEYGRELLALFARDAQESADHLKRWRDAGGTHGCVSSMSKDLGGDIDRHIEFAAEVKRLFDAG